MLDCNSCGLTLPPAINPQVPLFPAEERGMPKQLRAPLAMPTALNLLPLWTILAIIAQSMMYLAVLLLMSLSDRWFVIPSLRAVLSAYPEHLLHWFHLQQGNMSLKIFGLLISGFLSVVLKRRYLLLQRSLLEPKKSPLDQSVGSSNRLSQMLKAPLILWPLNPTIPLPPHLTKSGET